MKQIDWSSKHDIMILSDDGTLQPMDEPWFRAVSIAPGTWQIESDGDYSYLVEGDEEAILIDSGYGSGNIREYCQSLTDKPVNDIINTHDHFDHTANNGYFEKAYMSEYCARYATIPFNSFAGIDFPRDYPKVIIDEGDVIPLKGRELEVLLVHDHTMGSLLFLDRRERILFAGDEIWDIKPIKVSVEEYAGYMRKLVALRTEYDLICAGSHMGPASVIDDCLAACEKVLAGEEGVPVTPGAPRQPLPPDEQGRTVYRRRLPRPGDGGNNGKPRPQPDPSAKRTMLVNGHGITYDIHNIYKK